MNTSINFTIIKSRQKLEKQWTYLVKRGNRSYFNRGFFLVPVVLTGVYLLFYFVTPIDNFINLKGVGAGTIIIGWVAIILFFIVIYFRNIKNNWQLQKFLNTISSDHLSYDVQINDDFVKIISGENVTELPWTDFTQFGMNNDTIYVFNKANEIELLYWDRDEMGNVHFSALQDLLIQKSIQRVF